MSAFEYVGYDRAGHRCRGIIDARDAKETRERLAEQGILADRVRETRGSGSRLRRGTTVADRILFYEELASLLGADVSMIDALGILFSAPDAGVEPRVVAQIRDAIRDGKPLATALEAVFGNLPAFETAVLEAGQRAGALPAMLERLAGFIQTQRSLADKVRSALIYPAFVIGFAVVMVLGIVGFGLPAVGRLLGDAGVELPWMIRWAMRWGAWSVIATLSVTLMLVLALHGGFARAARNRDWRLGLERALFKLPFIGVGYTLLVNLRFVRTLELLIVGGNPIVDSLALSGTASGSAWVADSMQDAAERLRHGGCSPAEAVALSPPLAAGSVPAWIRTGEASGALGTMLGRLAGRLDQRWERFSTRALNLLLPVVILVVGAFVLAATLSIMLPILNLNRMLLQ